jgi:excisionase family DNA binding protein
MATKGVLGVGQMAKYCRVNRLTIQRWINNGMIKAFSLPGGFFRVEIPDFVDFLKKYNMPMPEDLAEFRDKRILVIDDEADVTNVITAALEGKPYDIKAVNSGIEGCIVLGTFKPSLVVLDVMMPGFDGVQVCREIRRNEVTAHTQILIITGFPDDERIKAIKEMGIEEILVKPFKPEELVGKVEKILSQPLVKRVPRLRRRRKSAEPAD